MAQKNISIKMQHTKGKEESYFLERDRKLVQQLREKSSTETTLMYRETHKHHCFRCGTASLVEIDEGNVKVDICINKDCGALHLDPGELAEILKNQQSLPSTRNAFLALFKK